MDDGSLSGWGTLFHEVTHHFVELNYKNPPAWFNEGLACLFGEQTRAVKGKLLIGKPNPWREYALREMIENRENIDIRHLTTLSTKEFYGPGNKNYHPARALFYWLYETGNLKPYLRSVRLKGYSVSVLEETLGKSSDEINNELLSFIKKNCYAGAFVQQARLLKTPSEKIPLLTKALELKPDYCVAWLELARCRMANGNYPACRENLKHILDAPVSGEYPEAAFLMGGSFYREKNFSQALIYYQRALDYADYNEDMYEVYHWMGNCYHFLKDNRAASQMHAKFLELNWEPQRLAKLVDYSKKYVEMSEKQLKQ
jgi:tetratricopeptide (TPR) repeat protein